MKGGKRSVRAGILIRLLALIYLPYLVFSMFRLYSQGEAGVSLGVFIAAVALMCAAELASAVSALLLWRRSRERGEEEEE